MANLSIIKKEIMNKTVIDTRNYRYRLAADGHVLCIKRSWLGTTAPIDGWKDLGLVTDLI